MFNAISKHLNLIVDQMPAYFLWKDTDSVYLAGCIKTAKLFGFQDVDALIGKTDYDILGITPESAEIFIEQDKKVTESLSPMLILNVHTYVDNDKRALLIHKAPLFNEKHELSGVSCYCTEVNNTLLEQIGWYLSEKEQGKLSPNYLDITSTSYYLNAKYSEIDLSNRQAECLFYLLRGKTSKQIAKFLSISPRTVDTHIDHIREKMGCNTKSEIIDAAIERGYFEIIPKDVLRNKLVRILEL